MPCSGITGMGIKEQIDESICPWYRGPAFIPFIDELPSLNRKTDGPFIMPIVDKYKDMGTVLMGKVESGTARKGINLLVMPNRVSCYEGMLFLPPVIKLIWGCIISDTSVGRSAVVRRRGSDCRGAW